MGSYLDARSRHGRWLVRMEDLDTPRVVPGAATGILRTLERLGLDWDGTVEYQSRHVAEYADALARLRVQGETFECSCSRRQLVEPREGGYPGTCRAGPRRSGPTATRFRVNAQAGVTFEDRIQGRCEFSMRRMGDVVIRRRDGVYAYQLAVVVDDARQAITDVVRGCDLLASTAWQIALQHSLGLPRPHYAHLPLVVEPDGSKLAKSRRSIPIEPRTDTAGAAARLLLDVLVLLRQQPPADLARQAPRQILHWAVQHWSPRPLAGVRQVPAPG